MKCKPKAHYLASTKKKKCVNFKMRLGRTYKFEFKMKSMYTNQEKWQLMQIVEAKKVHDIPQGAHIQKTHHNPNLQIVNILFLIIYSIICGKDYIEMTIKFETSKWEL